VNGVLFANSGEDAPEEHTYFVKPPENRVVSPVTMDNVRFYSRKGRLTRRTLLHRPQCLQRCTLRLGTPRKPVISFLRQVRIQACRLCGRDYTSKWFTSAGMY
jgi:hypothetical protein